MRLIDIMHLSSQVRAGVKYQKRNQEQILPHINMIHTKLTEFPWNAQNNFKGSKTSTPSPLTVLFWPRTPTVYNHKLAFKCSKRNLYFF